MTHLMNLSPFLHVRAGVPDGALGAVLEVEALQARGTSRQQSQQGPHARATQAVV